MATGFEYWIFCEMKDHKIFDEYFKSQTKFDGEPKLHYSNVLEMHLYFSGWRMTYTSKLTSDRWWAKGDHTLLINNNCFHKMKYIPTDTLQLEAVLKWATNQEYDIKIWDSINFIPQGFISR